MPQHPKPHLQLSPDGKYLAYIRPSGSRDVYNVFIKALPAPGQNKGANTEAALFEKEGVGSDQQVSKCSFRSPHHCLFPVHLAAHLCHLRGCAGLLPAGFRVLPLLEVEVSVLQRVT